MERRQNRLVCAGLLLGVFASYGVLLRAGFVNYDDSDYVTGNWHVRAGLTPGGILWAFTSGDASNWHPLTWISLMLDAQVYGMRAWGFHLTNLLLHAASTLLLLAVLKESTGKLWPSAFVAALFAWHPLHVESVAWIAERKDVLSGLFWMLAMLYYTRYAAAVKTGNLNRRRLYGLTLIFFVCGLMSKPMVVTLPFVLLLMDWWPLGRIADSGREGKSSMAGSPGWALVLKEKVPFFVLALASSVITFAVQRAGGAMAPLRVIPLHERIANACLSYAIYLRKMVWPADLAVFYPFKHHLPAWQWSGAALLIVALSAVALFSRTKRPYLAMGWFWYLGTLTPVIGLVQVGEQAMADRYAYLPLIGIFVILAWGANELASIWQVKPAALKLAAAAVLTLCLCLTARQAGYWKNSRTLFTHALAVTTDNPVAHANLGEALDKQGKTLEAKEQFLEALKIDPESVSTLTGLGVLNAHSGEIGAAIEYFRAALKRNPSSSDAHYGLGNALAGQGKFAEAAAEFEAAIRSKPDSADAYNNLGVMEFRQGLTTKAIDHFEAALRVDPDFPDAHSQLGSLLMQLGHPDAAISHFEEAVRLSPNFVPTRLKLGVALGQKRRLDAAIAQFSEALKLDPTNIAACYNLAAACAANNQLEAATQYFARAASLDPQDAELQGRLAAVLAVQGRAREAVIAYQAALRLNPDWPVALRDLAWLLATNPDPSIRNGAEAVKLAEHANALAKTPDPRLLEALDAAYAEAGRFEDAIRTAEKVRDLAAAAKEQDVAVHAAQRIALYKAGKPYHEGQPLR